MVDFRTIAKNDNSIDRAEFRNYLNSVQGNKSVSKRVKNELAKKVVSVYGGTIEEQEWNSFSRAVVVVENGQIYSVTKVGLIRVSAARTKGEGVWQNFFATLGINFGPELRQILLDGKIKGSDYEKLKRILPGIGDKALDALFGNQDGVLDARDEFGAKYISWLLTTLQKIAQHEGKTLPRVFYEYCQKDKFVIVDLEVAGDAYVAAHEDVKGDEEELEWKGFTEAKEIIQGNDKAAGKAVADFYTTVHDLKTEEVQSTDPKKMRELHAVREHLVKVYVQEHAKSNYKAICQKINEVKKNYPRIVQIVTQEPAVNDVEEAVGVVPAQDAVDNAKIFMTIELVDGTRIEIKKKEINARVREILAKRGVTPAMIKPDKLIEVQYQAANEVMLFRLELHAAQKDQDLSASNEVELVLAKEGKVSRSISQRVSEKEMKQAYKEISGKDISTKSLRVKKAIEAVSIKVDDLDKANTLLAKLNEKEGIKKASALVGGQNIIVDWFLPGTGDPQVEKTAFSLKKGQAKVIKGKDGAYYVIKALDFIALKTFLRDAILAKRAKAKLESWRFSLKQTMKKVEIFDPVIKAFDGIYLLANVPSKQLPPTVPSPAKILTSMDKIDKEDPRKPYLKSLYVEYLSAAKKIPPSFETALYKDITENMKEDDSDLYIKLASAYLRTSNNYEGKDKEKELNLAIAAFEKAKEVAYKNKDLDALMEMSFLLSAEYKKVLYVVAGLTKNGEKGNAKVLLKFSEKLCDVLLEAATTIWGVGGILNEAVVVAKKQKNLLAIQAICASLGQFNVALQVFQERGEKEGVSKELKAEVTAAQNAVKEAIQSSLEIYISVAEDENKYVDLLALAKNWKELGWFSVMAFQSVLSVFEDKFSKDPWPFLKLGELAYSTVKEMEKHNDMNITAMRREIEVVTKDSYRQALEIAKENESKAALVRVAEALWKIYEGELAIEALEKAAKIAPQDYKIVENLGYKCLQAKNWSKAISVFEKVIAINPNALAAYEALSVAYAAKGDTRKAAEYRNLYEEKKKIKEKKKEVVS